MEPAMCDRPRLTKKLYESDDIQQLRQLSYWLFIQRKNVLSNIKQIYFYTNKYFNTNKYFIQNTWRCDLSIN